MISASTAFASEWSLPAELILYVFEHFVALPPEARHQRDLYSLSLTCKLLHALATPQLFVVIDLHDSKNVMSLLNGLRADPKRPEKTKAVWWHLGASATTQTSQRRDLVALRNVDEVAWYAQTPETGFVGFHVALRDTGAWCDNVDIVTTPIRRVMGVPTLPGRTPSVMALDDSAEDDRNYERVSRAIWALGLVVGSFNNSWLRRLCSVVPTLRHLTVTIYADAKGRWDLGGLSACLNPLVIAMDVPLLEHLVIRATHFGEAANARRENSLRELRELCDTWTRLEPDWTVRIEPMPSFTSKGNVVADVADFTHQQWMERAHGTGHGPWADPKTLRSRCRG